MSRNGTITLIVVVLVIVAAAVYLMHKPAMTEPSTYNAAASTATTSDYSTTLPSGTDTSDASLQADLKGVDAQMTGFSADNSAASQSVSAQQTGGTPN